MASVTAAGVTVVVTAGAATDAVSRRYQTDTTFRNTPLLRNDRSVRLSL